MAIDTVLDGIIIGAAGGCSASIMFSLCRCLMTCIVDYRDSKKIKEWLLASTSNEAGKKFRSTRAIASWTNLSEDRVRSLCYVNPKIFLSTGDKEGMWSIHDRELIHNGFFNVVSQK